MGNIRIVRKNTGYFLVPREIIETTSKKLTLHDKYTYIFFNYLVDRDFLDLDISELTRLAKTESELLLNSIKKLRKLGLIKYIKIGKNNYDLRVKILVSKEFYEINKDKIEDLVTID
ncbi:TPA: hypothetical protein DD445_03015 [Candidatus Nomurabacteria bacterium]|nr:hypothetical protein [Candidatus Nomurabacteria bacterium]